MCGISDLDEPTTCYSQTLSHRSCRNPISEDSCNNAAKCLRRLAQQPVDDSLSESLGEIARLLLCKRYHRSKEAEQVQPLVNSWCERVRNSGVVSQPVRNALPGSRQQSSPRYPELYPADRTSTPLIPMDVEPAVAEPQSIRMEQLRRRSVRFEVSPASPARIVFRTPNADHTRTPVILHTLSQDDGSRRECLICHDDTADDIVYLKCVHCRRSVHSGCMGKWLERRWPWVNFNCPQW
jgi:hypothetical protein